MCFPRHKRLAWTIEWITSDGGKTIGDSVIDTCSIAEAYNRCHSRSKDSEPVPETTLEQEDSRKDSDISNNDGSTIAASGDPTAATEVTDEKPPPSSADGSIAPSTEEKDEPTAETISPHRGLYFYLHRPRTTTKRPVLTPLLQSSTLNSVLRNRTVLEFPTIYALPDPAATLFAEKGNSCYILEEDYLSTAGPEEPAQSSTGSDEDDTTVNQAFPGSSVNLQNVDEKRVLEVLKQDLFEPVPETGPAV